MNYNYFKNKLDKAALLIRMSYKNGTDGERLLAKSVRILQTELDLPDYPRLVDDARLLMEESIRRVDSLATNRF